MAKEIIKQNEQEYENETPTCGIVMPISSIDGCNEKHWEDVKNILSDAITSAGYKANLVSNADEVGIIQKRIVQNLYGNDIVVCDVSGKNANVMFELGLRLAFDKPTIIVIDDKTNYSFDTAIIEHLSYPRDLSYYSIVDFKEKLKTKIQATIKVAKDHKEYSPFLKNFGEFRVASIKNKEGSINDAVLAKIDELSHMVANISKPVPKFSRLQRVETDEIKRQINEIVSSEINKFAMDRGFSLAQIYMNNDNEKELLLAYLEQNERLRQLCLRPSRISQAIEDYFTF